MVEFKIKMLQLLTIPILHHHKKETKQTSLNEPVGCSLSK